MPGSPLEDIDTQAIGRSVGGTIGTDNLPLDLDLSVDNQRLNINGSTYLLHAYPIFNVDYRQNLTIITDWLERFENLQLIGRSGRYSYLNMDCAMESGIRAVENILARSGAAATFPVKQAAAPSRLLNDQQTWFAVGAGAGLLGALDGAMLLGSPRSSRQLIN